MSSCFVLLLVLSHLLVANELVEVDWAGGSIGFEVGGNSTEAEGLRTVGHFCG